MTNFDFLKSKRTFDSFADAAIAAERIFSIDPSACVLNCRRAMEFAVKWMYSVDKALVMHRKDCQHLRPITCPCVTALVVVGNGGFAALWVRRHDVVDGCAEVGVGLGYDFGNRDTVVVVGFIGKQDAHR